MLTINEILNLIQKGKINESKLDSKDLMKIEFYKNKLNEDISGNYITTYHRTPNIEKFIEGTNKKGIKSSSYKYGNGFYTTYSWEGVHTEYSKKRYGNYVVKILVKIKNIIFLDEKAQILFFGKPMDILSQFEHWGIKLNPIQYSKVANIPNEKELKSDVIDYVQENEIFFKYDRKHEESVGKLLIDEINAITYDGMDRDTLIIFNYDNMSIVGYYDETTDEISKLIPINSHKKYNSKLVSKQVEHNLSYKSDETIRSKQKITTEYINNWLTHYVGSNDKKFVTQKNGIYQIYNDMTFSNEVVNFPIEIENCRNLTIKNCKIKNFTNFPRAMYKLDMINCYVSSWVGFESLIIIDSIVINNCDIPDKTNVSQIKLSHGVLDIRNETKISQIDLSKINANTVYFINCENLKDVIYPSGYFNGLQIVKCPNININTIPKKLNYLLTDDSIDVTNLENVDKIENITDKNLTIVYFK